MNIIQSLQHNIQSDDQNEVQVLITTNQQVPILVKQSDNSCTLDGPFHILDHQTNTWVAKALIDCLESLGLMSNSETTQDNHINLTSSGADPRLIVRFPMLDPSERPMLRDIAKALVSQLKGDESESVKSENSLATGDAEIIKLSVSKTLKLYGGKRITHPVTIQIDGQEIELSGKLAPRPDLTQFEPQEEVVIGKFDGLTRRGEAFIVLTKSQKTISIQFGKRPISAAEIGAFMDDGEYFQFVVMVTRKKNGAEIYTLDSFTKLTDSVQTT